MNRNQHSMLLMQRHVLDLLENNHSIISRLPAFAHLQTSFKTNLAESNSIIEKREKDTLNRDRDKICLRGTLAQKSLYACRQMALYAKTNRNEALATVAGYTEWELTKMTDDSFIAACTTIYTTADDYKWILADYGLTALTQKALKNAINAYKAVIDIPIENSSDHQETNSRLDELIDHQNTLLDKMDALVEMMKDSHPTFYAEYRNAREAAYQAKLITV